MINGVGFPSPPGTAPRRERKASPALLVAGITLVALVLGGLVGGITGMATTTPPGSTVAPSFPAYFPTQEQQYLRGVTVALIADDWLKKGNSWRCADEAQTRDLYSGAKRRMECRPANDAEYELYVSIEYDADDKVRVVQATCHLGTRSPVCKSLFAAMADTLLAPQPELRKQADQWAQKHAAGEGVTTIGGIRLEISLTPSTLRATPAA